MKTIAVISIKKSYSDYIKEELEIYFSENMKINSYSLYDIEEIDHIKEKYIILPSFTIFNEMKKKTLPSSKIIIASLSLNNNKLNKLKKLEKGTKAILANINYRSCMEVITLLDSAGFNDLELIPYYDGIEYDDSIKIAITPGELDIIPKKIKKIIDIGQRVVDVDTIFGIANIVGVKDPFKTKKAEEAKKRIFKGNKNIENVLIKQENLKENLNILLKLFKQGIIITDKLGKIHLYNQMAKDILKERSNKLEGYLIEELLPELESLQKFSGKFENSELIKINQENIVVTVSDVSPRSDFNGNVILLEKYNEVEDRQNKIRNKVIGRGHKANYTFADIIGDSKKISDEKRIAERMAKSNSSVVIYGESGTGKELFAQAIHNHSTRKDNNFVAVNCSAFPENLLESELYGYEGGAFTGAKKEGKFGLFELAHNGTLFLDEIGDMPLILQSKLLRSIEEKKILRIGGKDMINIDVRIIAATHKNLMDLIKKNEFRKDLYYRINVLPLYIPPLRERKEDIIRLFKYFCKKFNIKLNLTQDAREKMINYYWDGNIRELKNVVEYLQNLAKETIEYSDLLFEVEENSSSKVILDNNMDFEDKQINQFMMKENTWKLFYLILSELYDKDKKIYKGRNQITEDLKRRGCIYSTEEIKNSLSKLKSHGFVFSNRGRKGSNITEIGIVLKDKLEKML